MGEATKLRHICHLKCPVFKNKNYRKVYTVLMTGTTNNNTRYVPLFNLKRVRRIPEKKSI